MWIKHSLHAGHGRGPLSKSRDGRLGWLLALGLNVGGKLPRLMAFVWQQQLDRESEES